MVAGYAFIFYRKEGGNGPGLWPRPGIRSVITLFLRGQGFLLFFNQNFCYLRTHEKKKKSGCGTLQLWYGEVEVESVKY